MNFKFYRIYLKKSSRFLSVAGKSSWYPIEIHKIKRAIKNRLASNKKYKFTDFIVMEFTFDKLPERYYCLEGKLISYDKHKDMIEALHE